MYLLSIIEYIWLFFYCDYLVLSCSRWDYSTLPKTNYIYLFIMQLGRYFCFLCDRHKQFNFICLILRDIINFVWFLVTIFKKKIIGNGFLIILILNLKKMKFLPMELDKPSLLVFYADIKREDYLQRLNCWRLSCIINFLLDRCRPGIIGCFHYSISFKIMRGLLCWIFDLRNFWECRIFL